MIAKYSRRLIAIKSRPFVVAYDIDLHRWAGPEMTIVVLADLHVVAPWTSLQLVADVVRQINDLSPDMIVLGGDYLVGNTIPGTHAKAEEIVAVLRDLSAPLGVFAIMGNHDWMDCTLARKSGFERSSVVEAFEPTSMNLMRNVSAKVEHGGHPLWVVGLDSQNPGHRKWKSGRHRPEQGFADVPADAPAILLAHEPDYFAKDDTRAGLQISGHTHGGQLNLFGWRPMTPSQYGSKYAYGHIQDGFRNLVVSGGLGFSGLPMRIGQAPEITLIRVRAGKA